MQNKKFILFILSGSVAAYRTCDVISALVKEGRQVRCVMTRSATQFITPLTIETVSRNKVFLELFDENPFNKALHIALAEEAGLIVVMPATANILAKIALGLADDLASSIILSAVCPLIIVPAMNTQMLENPATQKNLKELKQRGIHFVDPIYGELTCGTVGVGHVAETEKILQTIRNF